MSWLAPDDFAQDLLTGTAADVLQLAKYSALAPRIEPVLLRNMRVKFLPGSEPDLEHRLWFSNLVSARSTKNIVLDQGIARLLADQLTTDPDLLAQVWRYTQVCTAHWSGLDKLEQQLRYNCLHNDQNAINQGLQAVLSKISKTQDEDERLTLARWAKKTLPAISSASAPSEEIAWLTQYAATALGATASWTTLSFAKPMPDWLSSVLPAAFAKTQIGLQLRYDSGADHQVLACLPPESSGLVLELPTPLPARLYVRTDSESEGRWLVVNVGSLIKIPNNAKTIELRTIDGKGYQLQATLSSPQEPENTVTPVSFYLIHVREDAETATQIAEQLQKFFNLHINLIAEQPGETAIESQPGQQSKVLRLWTPNAQRQWARIESEPFDVMGNSLLLRQNHAELPRGASSAQVLDLTDTASLLKGIQQWLDNSDKPFLEPDRVTIPAGWFLMGGKNNSEQPLHIVTITKPFALGKYPVTFAEYDLYAEAMGKPKPNDNGWDRGNRPIINVNWFDAVAYAEWLSRLTGKRYRLPSEAEWEYAARAAPNTESQTDYYWGEDNTQDYVWYSENSKQQTHPVGQLKPNAFGLYDMSGNVWEWVEDFWHEHIKGLPIDGSAWRQEHGSGVSNPRVLRGGSWRSKRDFLRSGNRYWERPDTRGNDIGFRHAQDLPLAL